MFFVCSIALQSAPSITPIISIPNPVVPGNANTSLRVWVDNGGAYVTTGTLTIREGNSVLGSALVYSGNFFNVPVFFSTAGTHTVIASYSGDVTTSSAQSLPIAIQVVATSVVLSTSGPAGLVFSIHAVVTGPGPCKGVLALADAGKVLSTATVTDISLGVIDFSTNGNPQIPVGIHLFTASFTASDSTCGSAASTPLSTYTGYPTSTTEILSITPNPSLFSQLPQANVRVTAAVGNAIGQVTLYQSGVLLGSGSLDASASARVNLPSFPVGSWPLVAVYAGSPTVQASTSAPFALLVKPALLFSSSASAQTILAPDSLATVYGTDFSFVSVQASSLPLPVNLGGVHISVLGTSEGAVDAALLFVSPGQVNFLVPATTKMGTAFMSLSGGGKTLLGDVVIESVSPSVFTADGSGSGAPIGILYTAHSDGMQESHPAYDCSTSGCRTAALDVSNPTDTNVLVLYTTGLRNTALGQVTANVANTNAAVLFSGAQSTFPGLDQVNLQLSPVLAGLGEVNLQITAAGKQANLVKLRFR